MLMLPPEDHTVRSAGEGYYLHFVQEELEAQAHRGWGLCPEPLTSNPCSLRFSLSEKWNVLSKCILLKRRGRNQMGATGSAAPHLSSLSRQNRQGPCPPARIWPFICPSYDQKTPAAFSSKLLAATPTPRNTCGFCDITFLQIHPRPQAPIFLIQMWFTAELSRQCPYKFPFPLGPWKFVHPALGCLVQTIQPPGTVVVVVQLLSRVWLSATPWTAAYKASLSFTISWSLLKLMSIESMTPSNHLIRLSSGSHDYSEPSDIP